MSNTKLTGSCHCKAIAFEVANVGAEPIGGIVCHCQVRAMPPGCCELRLSKPRPSSEADGQPHLLHAFPSLRRF